MLELLEEKKTTPKWLKHLQENSWELELLISGGAIFSLFKLSDLLLDYQFTLKMTSLLIGLDIYSIAAMLAIKMLTLGFCSHLLLRAFWLGMICINYVFPGGMGMRIAGSKTRLMATSYKEGDNLLEQIVKVDKACGMLLFVSVLSTAVIAGLVFILICLLTLPSVFIDNSILYANTILILLLLYIIDLFSFGLLRKTPYASKVIVPLFKVFDLLSFRYLYYKTLALYSSNVNRLRSFVGFLILITVSFFLVYDSMYSNMRWRIIGDSRTHRMSMAPDNNWTSYKIYMDEVERKGLKYSIPAIQSEIIKENVLKVFIPYSVWMDQGVEKDKLLSDYVSVQINDSTYTQVEWFNYLPKNKDQLGITTLIDIKHLPRGRHRVVVKRGKDEEATTIIPFWKDL